MINKFAARAAAFCTNVDCVRTLKFSSGLPNVQAGNLFFTYIMNSPAAKEYYDGKPTPSPKLPSPAAVFFGQ